MFKRISVVFFAVLLVVSLLPMSAFATSHTLCESGHDYELTETGSIHCALCDLKFIEVSGKVDDDGDVDEKDAIALLYHAIFGAEKYPLTENYDFNYNGKVDAGDAIYLLKYTLYGPEQYPLYVAVDPDSDEGEDDKDMNYDDWIPMPW